MKFSSHFVQAPTLTGIVRLDLDAWSRSQVLGPALGLFVLLLRDLMEGDLRFGMHASKGYGACTVSPSKISVKLLGCHAPARLALHDLPPLDPIRAGFHLDEDQAAVWQDSLTRQVDALRTFCSL